MRWVTSEAVERKAFGDKEVNDGRKGKARVAKTRPKALGRNGGER